MGLTGNPKRKRKPWDEISRGKKRKGGFDFANARYILLSSTMGHDMIHFYFFFPER